MNDIRFEKIYNSSIEESIGQLTKLIDLAEISSDRLKSANEALLKIRLSFLWALALFSILALVSSYYITKHGSDTIFNVFLFIVMPSCAIFIMLLMTLSVQKIKKLNTEIKIEKRSLMEILEVIYNIKEIVSMVHEHDVVGMVIIEIRLNRIKFY
ncbi:hypothetical protein ACSJL2_001958 [Serratia sarumanii]|uniref:hypothetical protein n=1 Tax=Serratia TaxID=613 RepID=UPI00076039EF|nr:hypothetical protein [Serratia marcescens]MBH2790682.1 hypothetical protein [Serratia marcescens]MBI6196304.1 hypothetical protein [Serratia marcescens]WAZ08193.1 hypothetical protein O3T11_17150 [Serratia marcescens]